VTSKCRNNFAGDQVQKYEMSLLNLVPKGPQDNHSVHVLHSVSKCPVNVHGGPGLKLEIALVNLVPRSIALTCDARMYVYKT
jgi:hypothetical protein